MLTKVIYFIISKKRHWRVVLNHWFWKKHYRGALKMERYKISDAPLNFKLHYNSTIEIGNEVSFAGTSKLLAIQGGNLRIGKGTFFNENCSLNALSEVEIGENCLFGENVKIYDHNHRFNQKDQFVKDQGYTLGKVTIGNNCWIGSNVVILKGVKIGENVVIGANCTINSDIPKNTIITSKNEQVLKAIRFK